MNLNYKSKAVFLLDSDKEGKKAKSAINEAKEKYRKKNCKLKALLLQPTEDMKDTVIYLMPKDSKKDKILKLVQQKIGNGDASIMEGFQNTIIELEKEFG